jgi:hypothetical protein
MSSKQNRIVKVLLVAHTNKYCSFENESSSQKNNPLNFNEYGIIQSANNNGYGLGADDRAGCTILWLLRDMGYSILCLLFVETGWQMITCQSLN